jgi:kynureninase
MSDRDLTEYRVEFDSIQHCRYFISNSLGAMPNRAREYTAQFNDIWADRGVRAWEEKWWLLAREVGDKIACLMNAEPDSVSMHPNVTSAQAVVLSCFDFGNRRNKVVMTDMEFPSTLYLYGSWLQDRGRLEIVECPDGVTVPLKKLLEAIDEDTLLVPISSVLFRSSCITEAKAIVDKAHAVGAMVLLDVYHSVGIVPLDVQHLGVDFAAGGCLKWLCGGPGACFLYVRPDLISQLEPRFTGWLAHENPFMFRTNRIQYTTGAYKFQNGTTVIPALYTCQAGLDIVAEIGMSRIRARSLEMTSRLLQVATERGWSTITPIAAERRGGTVVLAIPQAEAVAGELVARDFLVDYRPGGGIRVSPHFYNTDDEIDDLISEIERIQARISG